MKLSRRLLLFGAVAAMLCPSLPAETKIPMERLRFATAGGVVIKPLMRGQIPEVQVDLVSITGDAVHQEPAHAQQAVVWLLVDGKGVMTTKGQRHYVEDETIARAPQGWAWHIEAAPGSAMQLLRIRRSLTREDMAELEKFPEFQVAAHVKKFRECPAYGEAIKSAKTVSRTLLPENYVPRMALGTVETTGPDAVAPHRHPMLEQLFLGLRGNDITVTADDGKANLREFHILHIPLGSFHGAQVEAGKKLHYVWMDFFGTKEGQEWLKMHKPLETEKP